MLNSSHLSYASKKCSYKWWKCRILLPYLFKYRHFLFRYFLKLGIDFSRNQWMLWSIRVGKSLESIESSQILPEAQLAPLHSSGDWCAAKMERWTGYCRNTAFAMSTGSSWKQRHSWLCQQWMFHWISTTQKRSVLFCYILDHVLKFYLLDTVWVDVWKLSMTNGELQYIYSRNSCLLDLVTYSCYPLRVVNFIFRH